MAQQTAVEWLQERYNRRQVYEESIFDEEFEQAKAMEKDQRGYSKEDVLKAGEIGEINHHDYKHIVSLLDKAREINNK
jgi:hypothetical protein